MRKALTVALAAASVAAAAVANPAPADAVVIELGRQIWRDHKVTSQTFATAKAIFGPNMLIDIVMLMGNYAGTAALLATVDMQLHTGKKPMLPMP